MITASWIGDVGQFQTKVRCAEPECENRLSIDPRHARNFEGRAWFCAEHDRGER